MPTMIVLATGGSLEAAMLPQRLLYLRADYGVEVRAAVSAGARRTRLVAHRRVRRFRTPYHICARGVQSMRPRGICHG